jgi:chromosome partitioning protein
MTKYAKVVTVANQKGGVAKTTTAINLAASLAMADQRILLIDLDPQANLTSGVGLKGRATPGGTVYDVLTRDDLAPNAAILKTIVDNLSLIPADRNLTGAEIELVELPEREYRLRRLLDALRGDFDYIFIDTPPSLGLLTLNALVAADGILIPLNCEYFALEGIADLLSTVEHVRAALNPDLTVEGVLLTMYDERTNLGQQVSTNIREFFGEKVFKTVIPRNIRLGEAPSHGVPVILYDARSRGAESYVALAHEFLARNAPESAMSPGTDAIAAHAGDADSDAGAATTAGGDDPTDVGDDTIAAAEDANVVAVTSIPQDAGASGAAADTAPPVASPDATGTTESLDADTAAAAPVPSVDRDDSKAHSS